MDDLFRQFRDNLESRPEPPFDERHWRNLEKRLARQDRRRTGFAWWWAVLTLSLLMLGANGLVYRELRQARKKITTLEQRLASATASRDTAPVTSVIYHTDTVYRTRVRWLTTPAFAAGNPSGNRPLLSQNPDRPGNPLRDEPIPYEGRTKGSAAYVDPAEAATPNRREIFPFPQAPPRPVDFPLADRITPTPELPGLIPAPEKKKTLGQHLYAMRPKGYQLALAGGWGQPFSPGLEALGGFSAGLEGVVEFSPTLQLWTDVAFVHARFASDDMDERIGIPTVNPPGDQYRFQRAETPQPSLQYAAGMQYLFPGKSKLIPFAGAGVGAVSLLPYEVIYDFRESNLGVEWIFEKSVDNRALLGGLLFLRAGMMYELGPRWQALFRVTYRQRLTSMSFQIPNMLGVQSGLRYRF